MRVNEDEDAHEEDAELEKVSSQCPVKFNVPQAIRYTFFFLVQHTCTIITKTELFVLTHTHVLSVICLSTSINFIDGASRHVFSRAYYGATTEHVCHSIFYPIFNLFGGKT